MRRFLPSAFAAILLASALAWGQFKGPDTKPRGHTPTFQGISISISGAPTNAQKWVFPLAVSELFPSNFVGSPLDGYAGFKCLTNPSASDVYTVKCTPSGGSAFTMGTATISGSTTATVVQQVQVVSCTTTNGVASCATAMGTTTKGNLIAVFVSVGTVNGGTYSVSDTQGNTYSTCGPAQNATGQISTLIFYAPNIAGGANSVSYTMPSNASLDTDIVELSGVSVSPTDVCGSGATGNTNAPSSSVTSNNANDVLLTGAAVASATITVPPTINSGWTLLTSNQWGGGITGIWAYQVASAAQAYTGTFGISTGNQWAAQSLALKLGGGTAGTATFATTNGLAQLCLAQSLFEVDAPATVSTEVNCGLTLPAHQP